MRLINLEYHPNDSRIKIDPGHICQTLSQRMGTGGNNVPLILLVDCSEEDGDVIDISESNRPSDGEQSSRQLLRTRCI